MKTFFKTVLVGTAPALLLGGVISAEELKTPPPAQVEAPASQPATQPTTQPKPPAPPMYEISAGIRG